MTNHQNYSRLARVENQKAKRTAFVYGGLTLGLIFIILFFGLKLASRFANIINQSGSSDSPIKITDQTPPAPPKLDSIAEFTSKNKLTIEGSAEAGSSVNLKVNGKTIEIVTDADGRFSTPVDLQKGENTISATTIDQSGNESATSNALIIIFDNELPTLTITKPQNGDSFGGSNKQITIEGETNPGASVTINDRVAIVGSSGKFSQPYNLSEGNNTLTIKVTDEAGNEIEEKLTVSYSP